MRGEILRAYGSDRVFCFYGDLDARFAELAAMDPTVRAGFRAFAGHVGFGIDPLAGGPLTAFTMLRDPVERIVSHYAFARRNRHAPLQASMLEGVQTLDEYVERSPAASLFNNGMVRLLGGDGAGPARPADPEQLATAIARIRSGAILVGLQDRYAESLALFARRFGWKHATLTRANAGDDPTSLGSLPAATLARIARHNALDLELSTVAREVFASTAAAADLSADVRRIRRLGHLDRARSTARRAAARLRR